jgi:uncharacterized membrane protein YqgA involved in biofilm formation
MGTLVNVIAIIIGSVIGMLLGQRFFKKYEEISIQGTSLVVVIIGLQMALKITNPIPAIFCILFGGIIGQAIDIEKRLEDFGEWVKLKVKMKDEKFTEAFVTASLIYCVGSMAIIGSINDGINGNSTILITKAVLDGIISIALASTLGIGVAFSALPILIYQGSITLLAKSISGYFTESLIIELSAVGGILIMVIGLNMLKITKIKVANMLPSVLLIIIYKIIVG